MVRSIFWCFLKTLLFLKKYLYMTSFWVTLKTSNFPCTVITLNSGKSSTGLKISVKESVILAISKAIEKNPHFKENCHNVPSRHISILVPMLCHTKNAQMPKKFKETGNIDTFLVCTPLTKCPGDFSVDEFAEFAFPVSNYSSPANKWISFLHQA